jgi:multidrug efflux pump subunit AcrA (membrane-fusion protein)
MALNVMSDRPTHLVQEWIERSDAKALSALPKVGKKTGELISGGDVMINLLSPHYEVNVDISEIDVRKISVGDEVAITLDAFGTDAKFTGNVMSIDPGPTVIQDVVYYKVRINISDTELPIKPGMTANISVATDLRTSVLYVPSRAVKFNAEEGRYVMVLEQGVEKEYPVKVGLKANEGKLEIIEGLREGQVVILSKQEKK